MKPLRMLWYTSGTELLCRWVDADEEEKSGVAPTRVAGAGSNAADARAEAKVNRTEIAVGKAA